MATPISGVRADSAAAKRVGLSPKKVRKEINRELRRLKVVDPDRPPPMEAPEIEGPI